MLRIGSYSMTMRETDSAALWRALHDEIDGLPSRMAEGPVSCEADPADVRAEVERAFDLSRPMPAHQALRAAARLLESHTVQVTHPRYLGLFNPSVRQVTVAADALVAAYNPQLAAYSHASGAIEMERHALRALAPFIGMPGDAAMTFTSGGSEANLTAILAALAHRFPTWAQGGIASLPVRPAIYASVESHHSFVKIARLAGLGADALRLVPVDGRLALDPAALARSMEEGRAQGFEPLAVVATAGTTGAGVIDPLPAIAEVANGEGAWLHVDAAWGGAAALSPRLRPRLAGIERADSVTWDAHKWLQVPMGTGMCFCRHPAAVARAFAVTTGYMPAATEVSQDLFTSSVQWSRRALGVKVLLALAELSLEGWGALVERMADLGDALRVRLREAGWQVVNETPLPVVCATHADLGGAKASVGAVVGEIQHRGRAWVSEVVLTGNRRAVRMCITSFRTTEGDLDVVVEELERARQYVRSSSAT
jgi:glutamate/tyrosine decarboxylase-like PLP-dependent enzyme